MQWNVEPPTLERSHVSLVAQKDCCPFFLHRKTCFGLDEHQAMVSLEMWSHLLPVNVGEVESSLYWGLQKVQHRVLLYLNNIKLQDLGWAQFWVPRGTSPQGKSGHNIFNRTDETETEARLGLIDTYSYRWINRGIFFLLLVATLTDVSKSKIFLAGVVLGLIIYHRSWTHKFIDFSVSKSKYIYQCSNWKHIYNISYEKKTPFQLNRAVSQCLTLVSLVVSENLCLESCLKSRPCPDRDWTNYKWMVNVNGLQFLFK